MIIVDSVTVKVYFFSVICLRYVLNIEVTVKINGYELVSGVQVIKEINNENTLFKNLVVISFKVMVYGYFYDPGYS